MLTQEGQCIGRGTTSGMNIREENLSEFSSDVKYLWATTLAETNNIPSPIQFLRDYVGLSKPLLIHNAFPTKSLDEIIADESSSSNEDVILNVDITPDGHGDCIRVVNGEQIFVMPQVEKMSLEELRDGLRKQQQNGEHRYRYVNDRSIFKDENEHQSINHASRAESDTITDFTKKVSQIDDIKNEDVDSKCLYYSRQNDCLRSELPSLSNLFPASIQFADEAFDAQPEAINLWIGNERSVSSMHKDHYENIFCVAHGEKVFTICPPSDAMFLKEKMLQSGTFRKDESEGWVVDLDVNKSDGKTSPQMVKWIESDVERIIPPTSQEDRDKYLESHPLLQYAHPMKIVVKAGDMLYLPSLWYHRVTQTSETVAVNYWYDMKFDSPL